MTHDDGFRGGSGWGLVGCIAIALACPWTGRAEGEAAARMQADASGSARVERTAEIAAGTSVHAVLESKLDARSVKLGDTVRARASRAVRSGDRVVLPRGSKLLGRIRLVEAGGGASARSESRLGVSFDRAVLPDGEEVVVDLAIQAIAAAESDVASAPRARGSSLGAARVESSARGSGGGLLGGPLDLVSDAPELGDRIATDVDLHADASLGTGLDVDGALSASSEGVIGLRGMQLDSTGKSSVIVRASGPVQLSSGTRLLLRAKGEVSAH